MIAFTILGLLVFWLWCFEVGYHLVPAFQTARALIVAWLIGREAEHLISVITAQYEGAKS